MGHEPSPCAKAENVLAMLMTELPHALLQDVRMPGLDLDRLIADIPADPRSRSLRIVISTASMDLDELAQRVGADAVLEKPFRPSELRDAVGRAIAGMR